MVPRTTAKTLPVVLARFTAWALAEDKYSQKDIANRFDVLLDDLSSEDAFGTEAQNDPRGDGRNF